LWKGKSLSWTNWSIRGKPATPIYIIKDGFRNGRKEFPGDH
jgi:hypothetical protein